MATTKWHLMQQLQAEMREHYGLMKKDGDEFLAYSDEDERLHPGNPGAQRTEKKNDLRRKDAFDSWSFHAECVRTFAAMISAEGAMVEAGRHI